MKYALFSFLKKTVLAVLDCLVNPLWPYLPDVTQDVGGNSERIERAWSSVPDDPLNYDFAYHVLEADDHGRQPKIDEYTLNEMFNRKSVSCLRRIAESEDKVGRIKWSLHNVEKCFELIRLKNGLSLSGQKC